MNLERPKKNQLYLKLLLAEIGKEDSPIIKNTNEARISFLHENLVKRTPETKEPSINPANTKEPNSPKKRSCIANSYLSSEVQAGMIP
jgi:hypothetical protein